MTRYNPTLLGARRKAAGYTRRQAADRLGISPYTVACHEQGQRRPSVELIGGLADLYGCGVDAFYERGRSACLAR